MINQHTEVIGFSCIYGCYVDTGLTKLQLPVYNLPQSHEMALAPQAYLLNLYHKPENKTPVVQIRRGKRDNLGIISNISPSKHIL